MTSDIATVSTASDTHVPPRDVWLRLLPLRSWGKGLVLVVVLLTASFFLAGYLNIYWRTADMDLIVVHNALASNDGKILFFDHPAYFTVLSVKLWFWLLHSFGLLDAWTMSAIPSASDVAAFDAAITSAVRAARVAAFLTAVSFVLIFAGLIRQVVRDWRLAGLATFAFAFSGGIGMHMRILRSEMIAACLFTFALLILIIVARRGTSWRPLAIAVAACLCILGLENKVHAILLIAALPVMIQPFGTENSKSAAFWTSGARAWLAVLAIAIVAGMLLFWAMPMIVSGFAPAAMAARSLRPLVGGISGAYQAALLGWILLGVVTFALIWKVSDVETVATTFAVMGGASLGLLALNIQYDLRNAVVVMNPLEQMLNFADLSPVSATDGGFFALAGMVVADAFRVLQRYTFVLHSSPRPTVFLTWLVLPGIVYAWRRGEKQAALQAAILMLSAIGIDTLGMRRGLKAEYFIFTDPLIIIAGAVLLDRMSDLRFHQWAYPIGVALIVLHIGISQAQAVKHVLLRRGPEGICEWNQYYLPLMPVPWCDLPPKRP
jgi:hypothetical protein